MDSSAVLLWFELIFENINSSFKCLKQIVYETFRCFSLTNPFSLIRTYDVDISKLFIVYEPIFYVDGLLDTHCPLLQSFLQNLASYRLLELNFCQDI